LILTQNFFPLFLFSQALHARFLLFEVHHGLGSDCTFLEANPLFIFPVDGIFKHVVDYLNELDRRKPATFSMHCDINLSAAESVIDADEQMDELNDSAAELKEQLKAQDVVKSSLKSQLDAQDQETRSTPVFRRNLESPSCGEATNHRDISSSCLKCNALIGAHRIQ